MGTAMTAIFGYHPLAYVIGMIHNQVFLNFHSKSLVPTPAISN